jgi:LacI family transcriptional regulator
VPADLAVIGVDDDEALCSIACPALSSIRAAHAEVGCQAARLLHQMMKGIAPRQRQILISPGDVIARQSTDPMQVSDAQLQRALAFIDKNSREKLSVDDVARAAGLSRSVLQRRFRAHFGGTVLDAIQKQKIQTACRLLMETELKLADIAERAGFLHPEYFAAVFKKTMACTPRQYRQAVRRSA